MDSKRVISKKLVSALRHDNSLPFDADGWVPISELQKMRQFRRITADLIEHFVNAFDKRRLELSTDRQCVRASSGHTVNIRLDTLLQPITDPREITFCAHGTSRDKISSINRVGIHRMERHYVHFAADRQAIPRRADVLIHLDVEKYLRRGGKLFWTENGTIVTMGNTSGLVRPGFFKCVEFL